MILGTFSLVKQGEFSYNKSHLGASSLPLAGDKEKTMFNLYSKKAKKTIAAVIVIFLVVAMILPLILSF